ncbi:MAG: hypothetical protein WCP96_21195 [Methylococcaceae bacterium]
MKSNYISVKRSFLLASIAVFTTLFFSPVVFATDHETQCFNDVQGKIPWSDEKVNWEPENVKQLCKGTTNPSEPGKCFLSVKSGQVEWGKDNKVWEWKNIINLCAGTNDAKERVDCFSKGVSAGGDWRDVILLCQRTDNSQSKKNQFMN